MVWCNHCGKNVPVIRPDDGALACYLCGRVLENCNYSDAVTFVKNAAGQSQASGNIVRSVQSGMSSSRERRLRIARDELMNLKDALDESSTLSDVDDGEFDCIFRNSEEVREAEICFDLLNPEYNEKEAAKKAAAQEAANCPKDARNLLEASKAAVAKSRKEKRQKRAEAEKNAPAPATTMEAVGRMLEKKRLSRLINLDVFDDTSAPQKKSRTEEHDIVENEEDEEDEEDYGAPYEMNTDEKFYQGQVVEDDGYDFELY